MNKLAVWISRIDDLVWGPWMLVLLLGTGAYLMLELRFLPIRNLKFALGCALGRNAGKDKNLEPIKKAESGSISPFSSLMTELAATIGTGNIVGVATAMMLGGPGALFWMIVSSFLGMATKLVESMLSVKYRSYNQKQEPVGGPMYVMQNAFPNFKVGKLLGVLFSFFAVLASLGMGNMTQANSIADAMKVSFGFPIEATGLVVTILTILVVLGGIKSISRVTVFVVPVMGIFYLAGTFAVILYQWQNAFAGLGQIIGMAFAPAAFGGGIMGNLTIHMTDALRWGVSRGVFSNEAGLGASGISAAAANTSDYVRQGYISMTGVFIDTVVICSLTGLALSASGVLTQTDAVGQPLQGTALVIAAFSTVMGKYGAYFAGISISLFAFATIVGWAYQGEKAFEFLIPNQKYCIWYRFVYALTTFAGAVCMLEVVWDFSDICNGLMAIPNLICVLVLSKGACREISQNSAAHVAS